MAIFIKSTDCGGCDGCTNDPCNPSPDAPSPTLVCDSISASLTKCGFDEYGTPSSPPKKYRTRTLSGSVTIQYFDGGDSTCDTCLEEIIIAPSGYCEYSRSSCSLSEAASVTSTLYSPCGSSSSFETCYRCTLDDNSSGNCTFDTGDTCLFSVSTTSTELSVAGTTTCCSGGSFYSSASGTAYETLSNEYTTAHLIADVEAALPSYPGTWNGTCSSYRDLDADELTYTIRRFKYKFELPDLTGLSCYKITWMEGSTPREYLWNGSDTETPEYGPIDEPGTNGTIGISSVVATCDCI